MLKMKYKGKIFIAIMIAIIIISVLVIRGLNTTDRAGVETSTQNGSVLELSPDFIERIHELIQNAANHQPL